MLMRTLTIAIILFLFSHNSWAEKSVVPEFINGTERVNAERLIELANNTDDLVIIDSRKETDFQKGYIEGAISLPNTKTNARTLRQYLRDKSTPVVFYCNGIRCARSLEAAKIALSEGYNKIFWFRGGMEEWDDQGLPVAQH